MDHSLACFSLNFSTVVSLDIFIDSMTHMICIVLKLQVLFINFVVTPCINNNQHFNIQLTHTTLKNIELLKHFKISKTAPTCFGLQGNHHQGATIST